MAQWNPARFLRSTWWLLGLYMMGGVLAMVSNCGAPAQQGQPVPKMPAKPPSMPPVVLSPPKPNQTPPYRILPTPGDAVRFALVDILTVPPPDRLFVRYLYIPDGARQSMRTASLALNYISRGSVIYRPMPLAQGHLLRLDLRLYAPRAADLADWLKVWEELAFDPMFALLITRDTVAFAGIDAEDLPRRIVKQTKVEKVKVPGGNKEKQEEVEITKVIDVEVAAFEDPSLSVVRADPSHLDPVVWSSLRAAANSQAPVVHHAYFLTRVLSTIKDKGVYKDVFGGLYYDFRGIKKAKDVLGKDSKASDLDLFLENLGVGNIKAGLTAEALFDKLRSDRRTVVFRSEVTGKPREVTAFPTLSSRDSQSWGAITGDVADSDIDIGDRAFANILKPRRKAREALFPGITGLQMGALFNADGALQDEVPPDIAVDHTIPAPHTRRLQAIIGCIRCHGADGSDGWKPLPSDVRTLLSGKLDVFADAGGRRIVGDLDTLDRLTGLVSGDISKHLRRARDDVAEVTLRATGPWEEGGDQTSVARLASQRIADEYAAYNYDLVTPRMALLELGLDIPAAKAQKVFAVVLPPDLTSTVDGVVLEDPRIAALRAGIGINRSDWALVYGFAAGRSRRALFTQFKTGGRAWLERLLRD